MEYNNITIRTVKKSKGEGGQSPATNRPFEGN